MTKRHLWIPLVALSLAACAGSAGTALRDTGFGRTAAGTPVPRSPDLSAAEQSELDLLVLGLFMEEGTTRALSARKLAAFGPKARPALAYLLDCMVGDESDTVAKACAHAVGRIGEAALPSLERIAEQCPDRSDRVAVALSALGDPGAALTARLPNLPRECPAEFVDSTT